MTNEDSKQKMIDILNDTVKFYSEDPKNRRALKDFKGGLTCTYIAENGNKCAVGRYLNDTDLEYIKRYKLFFDEVYKLKSHCNTAILHELSDRFWIDLQSLHDWATHWDFDNKCLSKIGIEKSQQILERIQSGCYEKV